MLWKMRISVQNFAQKPGKKISSAISKVIDLVDGDHQHEEIDVFQDHVI